LYTILTGKAWDQGDKQDAVPMEEVAKNARETPKGSNKGKNLPMQ
jgi:hypothetical protein